MIDVQVRLDKHYGRVHAYPANHTAECFARIVGQKTLTRLTLLHILALPDATVTFVGYANMVLRGHGPDTRDNLNMLVQA